MTSPPVRAHAQGLQRIGLLSDAELADLERELTTLAEDFRSGAFVLDARFEDGHSAIESRLTERLGDTGRRIHAGRSRNDQILVATRLWLKEKLAHVRALSLEGADIALHRAEAERDLPMPGYTHLQRAVVSSAGLWWAGWAEAFLDNARRATDTRALIDANPLGTAAGYGVNLPLDRAHTTQVLGLCAHAGVALVCAAVARQVRTRGAGSAGRGDAGPAPAGVGPEFVHDGGIRIRAVACAVHDGQFDHAQQAQSRRGGVDARDVCERGGRADGDRAGVVVARGYHRDLQVSKGALFHGFGKGLAALALLPELLRNLEWNAGRMRAALEPSMYATDLAVDLAKQGLPFRDAYRQAADPQRWAEGDPAASLAARTSPGGAADMGLEVLRQRLSEFDA
jgi:argininosuccinate lyase